MSDSPAPVSFADFKLNKQLLTAVAEAGFTEPTPVQVQTIPLLLAGHDVLGIAQTGTGKTAAFGLPLLMKVKYAQGDHPRALIMAPTRELAMQLEKHLQKLAVHTDLRIFAIYGGLGPKTQIETIAKEIYGAGTVQYDSAAEKELKHIEDMGFGNVPVCIAKTPASFSDDPAKLGAPSGFTLHVREVKISAGAGFVVVLTGKVMTMPGLPKHPAAERIDVDDEGHITGLF